MQNESCDREIWTEGETVCVFYASAKIAEDWLRIWALALVGLLGACETDSPKPVGPSAAADLASARKTMQDIGDTMRESGEVMSEAGRTMRTVTERIRRTTVINVAEYPLSHKHRTKLTEYCHRLNGDVKFRGDRGPFICDSHEPMCDEPDFDAGIAGGCMEGPPHFIIYQVPVEALY
jgi:hypothetical protein